MSFLDNCGLCQKKDRFKNFTDCNGDCFGGARINCGTCAGGETGLPKTFGEDLCGVCGGDNSTCLDCDGVPNGGKVKDLCKQCLAPNDTSFSSACVKLQKNIPDSGPSTGGVEVVVLGAGLKNKTSVACKFRDERNARLV